jgi:hypothetical protein
MEVEGRDLQNQTTLQELEEGSYKISGELGWQSKGHRQDPGYCWTTVAGIQTFVAFHPVPELFISFYVDRGAAYSMP